MEPYLPIAYLNDFVFCPRSIYFHQLYGRVSQRIYHTTDQIKGKAAHSAIDKQGYSSATAVLQGMEVFSEEYNLGGKIDTFDQVSGELVERKKRIKVVYEGYIYQLYAQCHCLREMGYTVKTLKLYSMDDNKSYPLENPEDDPARQKKFEKLLGAMRAFRLEDAFTANPNKCRYCIYSNLCDVSLA